MKKSLIKKVLELRDAGLTTVDIAEELNISVDTALYLVLNGEKLLKESDEVKKEAEKKQISSSTGTILRSLQRG